MSAIDLTDVRFIAASASDRAEGLLGYVSFTLNGLLRLDGLTLRRTLTKRLALSFPARRDRAGRQHPYYRPVDDAAREALEAAVLGALASAVGKAA